MNKSRREPQKTRAQKYSRGYPPPTPPRRGSQCDLPLLDVRTFVRVCLNSLRREVDGLRPRKRKEYVQISAGRLYGSNTPPRSRVQRFCRIGRSPGGESRPRAQVSTACHVRFHFWNPTPAPPLLRFRTFLTATCPPRAPMTSSHFSEKGHAPKGYSFSECPSHPHAPGRNSIPKMESNTTSITPTRAPGRNRLSDIPVTKYRGHAPPPFTQK